jgi:SAM-dependent methyltransferase
MQVSVRGADRGALRRASFLFQDGVALCATLRGLDAIGLLEPSLQADSTVAKLRPDMSSTAFAHLRVGLRTLAQAGWLRSHPAMTPDDAAVAWTWTGREIACYRRTYLELAAFLATFSSREPDAWTRPWEGERAERYAALVDRAAARWELGDLEPTLREQVTAHLDGALAVPTLLWLDATGSLRDDGPALTPGESHDGPARLLEAMGWIAPDRSWTENGVHGLGFVAHLGLVGSYLPLFETLPDLYAGGWTPSISGEPRMHVELNARANAAAFARYFADSDPLVASIFDREPLAAQPRFVLHSDCGDGAWLARVHRLVRERTLRGRHLDEHPLLMIGVDRSDASVQRARRTLSWAGADALFLRGRPDDPDALRDQLAAAGLAIEDGLHLHAFVAHDESGSVLPSPGTGSATGAYLDERGEALDAAAVEAGVASHLARWAPHVARHGLVVLEAHCVAPEVTARHLGALHSVAYDAYQGYVGAHVVERPAFIHAARRAGLREAATGTRTYPTSRPFVAVSLNHLLNSATTALLPARDASDARADTWQPDPDVDLRDGRDLHELLYDEGDLRHPRLWASAPTQVLVTQTMATLEARAEALPRGEMLRVLDYGTGTALAAIELVKACRERAFAERLRRRGVGFELHLVDIPSAWFAQGHALVQDLPWTRCHPLIGEDGRFRTMLDVTDGVRMDVVVSSMVFHLIPPKALKRVAASLAGVTAPGGRLLWNAPDLGPPGPWAVPFHEPNRMVRERWKQLLAGAVEPATALQAAALRAARDRADRGLALVDDERADKRILRRPHNAPDVAAALSDHFTGAVTTQTHEIVPNETLDTLLVLSNQREYLPEIEDDTLRSALIRELMLDEVVPALRAGPASTGGGYNVHWTFGDFQVVERAGDDASALPGAGHD